jgi:hypothetical protein
MANITDATFEEIYRVTHKNTTNIGLIQYLHEFRNRIFGADLIPGILDVSIFINEKRRTNDAHIGFTVHLFLTPNAKSLCNFMIRIGKQRKTKVVLIIKFFLCFRRIRTDPYDVYVFAFKFF